MAHQFNDFKCLECNHLVNGNFVSMRGRCIRCRNDKLKLEYADLLTTTMESVVPLEQQNTNLAKQIQLLKHKKATYLKDQDLLIPANDSTRYIN